MGYKLDGTAKKSNICRNEIEAIIKNEHIDRNRFHEFSKFKYNDIIQKFYCAFFEHKGFRSELNPIYAHIKEEFYKASIGQYTEGYCWWSGYMEEIKSKLPSYADKKLFLILPDGWVYEGYTNELFKVLGQFYWVEYFYIVSSKFDWFVVYDSIAERAVIHQKAKEISS